MILDDFKAIVYFWGHVLVEKRLIMVIIFVYTLLNHLSGDFCTDTGRMQLQLCVLFCWCLFGTIFGAMFQGRMAIGAMLSFFFALEGKGLRKGFHSGFT